MKDLIYSIKCHFFFSFQTINVGHDFQAVVPPGLSKYDDAPGKQFSLSGLITTDIWNDTNRGNQITLFHLKVYGPVFYLLMGDLEN